MYVVFLFSGGNGAQGFRAISMRQDLQISNVVKIMIKTPLSNTINTATITPKVTFFEEESDVQSFTSQ